MQYWHSCVTQVTRNLAAIIIGKPESVALTLASDEISTVHMMMTLSFLFGFTSIQWLKAIDIMPEKDVGQPKLLYLCIAVFVEGSMNAIMKDIWNCCLVSQAEYFQLLSPVQFGKYKGRTSLDALLEQNRYSGLENKFMC
eukprot:15355657-Ditylum_brightwellii.AAC.1